MFDIKYRKFPAPALDGAMQNMICSKHAMVKSTPSPLKVLPCDLLTVIEKLGQQGD